MSEVKPKFAPKVQEVWDDCGTYVDISGPGVASKEIEFFVQELIESLIASLEYEGVNGVRETLKIMGYINE